MREVGDPHENLQKQAPPSAQSETIGITGLLLSKSLPQAREGPTVSSPASTRKSKFPNLARKVQLGEEECTSEGRALVIVQEAMVVTVGQVIITSNAIVKN